MHQTQVQKITVLLDCFLVVLRKAPNEHETAGCGGQFWRTFVALIADEQTVVDEFVDFLPESQGRKQFVDHHANLKSDTSSMHGQNQPDVRIVRGSSECYQSAIATESVAIALRLTSANNVSCSQLQGFTHQQSTCASSSGVASSECTTSIDLWSMVFRRICSALIAVRTSPRKTYALRSSRDAAAKFAISTVRCEARMLDTYDRV